MPSIKRTIYIGSPAYLSIENMQLKISNKETGEINSVPVEDIGVIELDNNQILINNYAIQFLSENNVVTVSCGGDHHPAGYFLPIVGHHLQSNRISKQVDTKKSAKKNLWKQLVTAKIRNQSIVLRSQGKNYLKLERFSTQVKSGDKENKEGQASRAYWKNLFGKEFKRERFGKPPNNLLNYGYSILRAVTARAIVSTGLHPSIGVHHKNMYNPFCLADDLMEPYRPFVDNIVIDYFSDDKSELTKEMKYNFLKISYIDCIIEDKISPLSLAIQKTCSSLLAVFEGDSKEISCPELPE